MGTAIDVTPSASRLVTSLRDIGYDFVTAIADVVDNSVSAAADTVDIRIEFDGLDSRVVIADNGHGMTASQVDEAMRFGSRRDYERGQLGRYGLGLKTASLSQGRRLTVLTRRSEVNRRISERVLDLDVVRSTDRWEVADVDSRHGDLRDELDAGPGTVVVWDVLDRVLPEKNPEGGWAKRRLGTLAAKTADYLGMVFHRRIEGRVPGAPLQIIVNGEKVEAWNPFAPSEEHTISLPPSLVEVELQGVAAFVRVEPYVLPPRNLFSSQEEFDRLGGPARWNRQQGLYLYRADRLIQAGGWAGIRAVDEHTKLGRAAVFFDTDLDDLLQTNVAKMRVSIPASLRAQLEPAVRELCKAAEGAYRRASVHRRTKLEDDDGRRFAGAAQVGSGVVSAAMAAGVGPAMLTVMEAIREKDPELAADLGW